MHVDVAIFGGGAAGLWLLDDLHRAGRSVVLFETGDLGSGQTVASQGIIHGGLKYTLAGMLSRSAASIRDMPLVWRECLAGQREPDLRKTVVRAACCYLWRTDSVASRLGMMGAKVGLRVAAESVCDDERPGILANCPGAVARMAEQVISPASYIENIAGRHRERILKVDCQRGVEFDCSAPGCIDRIELCDESSNTRLSLLPRQVVFTAGAGNSDLRRRAGLHVEAMQRRPLHMVLVRGNLPQLNGHCVDGAKTRVTVTSDTDTTGRTVWQLGGQLAEDGVALDERALDARTRAELAAVIPGLDLNGLECATYRVDRAEGRTPGGSRPESIQILRDGNTLTAWPTKLALVPELARQLVEALDTGGRVAPGRVSRVDLPTLWPRPVVASPPWETATNWQPLAAERTKRRKAA
jgi:glycine/D-amino acid oxidase-like deaminating enzyme